MELYEIVCAECTYINDFYDVSLKNDILSLNKQTVITNL
jgi:hypothetical protein